jgi:endonuclease/exonuclease/phosphatase family metal-dependent hydrolase
MKVLIWNACQAFRKKYEQLLAKETADLYIISEAEHSEILRKKAPELLRHGHYHWEGHNRHKGLLVFSPTYQISLPPEYDPRYRLVLPLKLEKPGESLFLLAVWTQNDKENHLNRYIVQLWNALQHYEPLLTAPCIIAGDFNSNPIWDRKRQVGNHTMVTHFLSERRIHSAFHRHTGESPGKEKTPTLYFLKRRTQGYHIDYCFASEELLQALTDVQIGSPDEWLHLSDHMPIWFDFDGYS